MANPFARLMLIKSCDYWTNALPGGKQANDGASKKYTQINLRVDK
jgi:hypothetical protein